MILPQFFDSPFQVRLSFHKLIERYEELAQGNEGLIAIKINTLLKDVNNHPELRDGITDISQILDNRILISELLAELFPVALTNNEIKAISIPYQGLIFNYSERFSKILKDAGPGFEINIRDFDDHQFYIACCCIILNRLYNTNLDFSKPLFYDIPDANGIIKHYRILYNADFMELVATEDAPVLSTDDIKLLLDNYDDIALWKQKFPARKWIMKGFSIMTLFDVTVQNAVSIFKDNLLGNVSPPDLQQSLEFVFSSIFLISNIQVGFTLFNKATETLSNANIGKKVKSFLLAGMEEGGIKDIMADEACHELINNHDYFAVADVDRFLVNKPGSHLANNYNKQGVKSFILAPVVKNNTLLGFLEVVSSKANDFNSVIANKLDVVMPYLVDTIDRKINEAKNRIQAVIQNSYTTLHPSVNWKFEREARNYIVNTDAGLDYHLKQITFKKVYPFYGQVDIQNSSITRNQSVQSDLDRQINQLLLLLEQLNNGKTISVAEQHLLELKTMAENLSGGVRADTEQYIQHYLETNIYPALKTVMPVTDEQKEHVEDYFKQTDVLKGDFYINRRDYEQTLILVNNKLTDILDKRQHEIQQFYPHYYERFKTDGVEHNIYIGNAITPDIPFDYGVLKRLRLWQLIVTAEMEMEQHRLKSVLPYHLGVTALILVFSTPIDIRFRMDEKHFDIDGAYNIRYEVIKKRIDKAHIKNTDERITQKSKLTIVYSKAEEAEEYRQYLHLLQTASLLRDDIEDFEIEELQGVSGLKALRIGIVNNPEMLLHFDFIYDKLYQQLN